MNVPTVAMIQNVFCQRKVVLVPAIRTIVSRHDHREAAEEDPPACRSGSSCPQSIRSGC